MSVPVLERAFAAGLLEQVCPACGIREAAGGYCSTDETPTGPARWRRGAPTPAQAEAIRARATSRRLGAATDLGNANPNR